MAVTLLVEDIATGVIVGDVPYTKLVFGQRVNDVAPWSAYLPYTAANVSLFDPARRIVHVDLDGRIVYSGILWTTQDDGLQLWASGSDLFSYLLNNNRLLATTKTYAATEQFAIVADLLATAVLDAPILGLTLRRNPTNSGTAVTITYNDYSRDCYGDLIVNLAKASNGFERTVTSVWSGGTVARYLDIWSPRAGRILPLVWEDGYQISIGSGAGAAKRIRDGTRYANRSYLIGAGTSGAKIIGTAVTAATTYPRLEQKVSDTTVTDATLAGNIAAGDLALAQIPADTFNAQVIDATSLGAWAAGDQVFINSDRRGISSYYRIGSWQATDDQNGLVVLANMVNGLPLGQPVRDPLAQMLADDRKTAQRIARLEGQ